MTLPSLPKQNKHKEASFGIQFRRWIEEHPMVSSSYELKYATGERMAFSAVTDAQIAWALKIKHKGALIRVKGTSGQPDYVWVHGPAHIVIRYPSFFCLIDIDIFILEKGKSLWPSRAREIAVTVVEL